MDAFPLKNSRRASIASASATPQSAARISLDDAASADAGSAGPPQPITPDITLDLPDDEILQGEDAFEGEEGVLPTLARMMLATGAKSQTELAERLQVSRSAISDAKNRDAAPAQWFLKLSRAPYHVNPAWLETGKGAMRLPGSQAATHRAGTMEPWLEHHVRDLLDDTPHWEDAYTSKESAAKDDYQAIPLALPLLSEIRDGLATQPEPSPAAFLGSWLKALGEPKAMRLLPVHGDAMSPALGPGDMVLVDESQKGIIEGEVYALRMDEQVVLRRLAKAPGKLVLKCDNPRWGDPVHAASAGNHTVEVIGRVVLAIRKTI